jgi:AAA15 family ATPase/GTPase
MKAMTKFIKLFKTDLVNIELTSKEDHDYYIIELYFCYTDYKIHIEFESNGIKKLVKMYSALDLLSKGLIVFIDEFDANINDVYLIKLLEYFSEYAKGQFVFTTHNVGPMEVLKKRKYALDFISRDGHITSWTKNGNYTAMNLYRKGMIDRLPFNIDVFDFLDVFGVK